MAIAQAQTISTDRRIGHLQEVKTPWRWFWTAASVEEQAGYLAKAVGFRRERVWDGLSGQTVRNPFNNLEAMQMRGSARLVHKTDRRVR
jgi:hypothetical protein